MPIGHYVLEHALPPVAQWRRQLPELTVSVNVSARQLEDMSLLSALLRGGPRHRRPPRRSASSFPRPPSSAPADATVRMLQGLKAMGVQLALDDFGIGASSSLYELRRLPLDALKLHPSVLSDLGRTPSDEPIVGALVELGHALGLSVVAEGVERAEQLRALRALGCDGAQGFWLGRPVAEDQVEAVLVDRRRPGRTHSSGPEREPGTPQGPDQRRVAELATQPGDVAVDHVRLGRRVPDLVEGALAAHRPARPRGAAARAGRPHARSARSSARRATPSGSPTSRTRSA